MAEVLLAAHAVDESLQDARAWRSIYRNDNKLGTCSRILPRRATASPNRRSSTPWRI